jgi:DnaD/phage-associated family protein
MGKAPKNKSSRQTNNYRHNLSFGKWIMSIKHMSIVWDSSSHSGNALLVLLAIADHANDEGICWPSISTIAKKARISERQTKRIIQDLADSGEIEIVKRGDGRGHSTIYKLKGDTVLSPFSGANSDIVMSPFIDTDISRKGDKSSIKGDKSSIKGDIAMSPEPPIESPIEPPPQQRGGGGLPRNGNPDYAEICTAIEQNGFGMMTPIIADEIADLLTDYPKSWILDAMKISVQQNKRKLSYAVGILRRWRADGRDASKTTNGAVVPNWNSYGGGTPDYMRE